MTVRGKRDWDHFAGGNGSKEHSRDCPSTRKGFDHLMLHFPELRAEDFEPWIDPEAPVREGKSLLEISVETAEAWKERAV
jgi:hypothetical protein